MPGRRKQISVTFGLAVGPVGRPCDEFLRVTGGKACNGGQVVEGPGPGGGGALGLPFPVSTRGGSKTAWGPERCRDASYMGTEMQRDTSVSGPH